MKAVDWQASIQRVLQAAKTLKVSQDAQQGDIVLSAQRRQQLQRLRLMRVTETETPGQERVTRTGDQGGRHGHGDTTGGQQDPTALMDEPEVEDLEPGKGQKLDRRA